MRSRVLGWLIPIGVILLVAASDTLQKIVAFITIAIPIVVFMKEKFLSFLDNMTHLMSPYSSSRQHAKCRVSGCNSGASYEISGHEFCTSHKETVEHRLKHPGLFYSSAPASWSRRMRVSFARANSIRHLRRFVTTCRKRANLPKSFWKGSSDRRAHLALRLLVDRMRAEVPMRVVLVDPPAGIDFGIQHGRGAGYETLFVQQRTRGDHRLRLLDEGCGEPGRPSPNFQGPFAQGPPAGRFVYVDVGTYAGQKNTHWSRRMIVPLARNRLAARIKKATSKPGYRLSATIPGRGKDGSPNCATVQVLGGWQVIEARTLGNPRRPRSPRDPLEHRQRRAHLPRGRRDAASDRTARLLARRTSGQARWTRLLGACRLAGLARLERVRARSSRRLASRTSSRPRRRDSSGTRRSATPENVVLVFGRETGGLPAELHERYARSVRDACRSCRRGCARSTCRRAWRSLSTKCSASGGGCVTGSQTKMTEPPKEAPC